LLAVVRRGRGLHRRHLRLRSARRRATRRRRIPTATSATAAARLFPTPTPQRPKGKAQEQHEEKCQARNHRQLTSRLMRRTRQRRVIRALTMPRMFPCTKAKRPGLSTGAFARLIS
jgi:hypothetical protein